MTKDTRGRRPEKEPPDPRVLVCAKDDQIGGNFFGERNNCRRRVAGPNLAKDLSLGVRQLVHGELDELLVRPFEAVVHVAYRIAAVGSVLARLDTRCSGTVSLRSAQPWPAPRTGRGPPLRRCPR